MTGRLRRRSARMARLMRLYLAKRQRFLEDALCGVGNDHAASEIHHMAGRIGDLLLDESRWLAVCPEHHRQITDNPKWAIEQGYSLPRIGAA